MGKYKKKIIFLVLVTFLYSCSPTLRYQRLVKKYPYLIQTDSISLIDTLKIEVPTVKHDTIIKLDSFLVNLHDTIILEKERLKVKIVRVKDSIIIEGTCDTIFVDRVIERKIPVKYYETVKENKLITYGKNFLIILFVLLGLILTIKILQFLKK